MKISYNIRERRGGKGWKRRGEKGNNEKVRELGCTCSLLACALGVVGWQSEKYNPPDSLSSGDVATYTCVAAPFHSVS